MADGSIFSKITYKIRIITQILKQKSLDRLLDFIAWNLPGWLFFYGHNVLTYTEKPTWQIKEFPDYTIRFARLDEADMLQVSGSNKKAIVERLGAGDKSMVVMKGDKLITMIWGAVGKIFIKLGGATFDTGDDGCFYYGSYTLPDIRLSGIGGTVHQLIHESYVAEGRQKNWAIISVNNYRWLQAILRKNYTIIGETYFVKFLFFNICYYKSWPFPIDRVKIFFKNPPYGFRAV